MIRIHRNHPSIIVWSMGNEDFFNGGPADQGRRAAEEVVAVTHQLDPCRRATRRHRRRAGGDGGIEPGTLGDVAGYNGDGRATTTRAFPTWCPNTAPT